MANTEGLQKTLEFIKDNPTEWDQQRWHMCFAGVALRVVKGATLTDPDCCIVCGTLRIDGRPVQSWTIADMAQEALELTHTEAFRLFRGNNDLEKLEALVAQLVTETAVPA
jgi:hypothetical protein